MSRDPYAPLKENRWRETAEIDARLERGELDEEGWHREMAALVVPAYLDAATVYGGSGKTGGAVEWEASRRLLVDAVDRPGSFLDVGCANGLLLESLVAWSPHPLEPYGLEIAPELAALARRRLPAWAGRIFVGNVLHWRPPRRFTYARTSLEYVPRGRRSQLVERLLGDAERVVVGVYTEEVEARPVEELLRGAGFEIAGRSERPHPSKPGMAYRAVWIDS